MIEFRKAQDSDPCIGKVKKWKTVGQRPFGTDICAEDPETRHYWNYWNSLEIHDNLLCKRNFKEDGLSSHIQLLVPKALRSKI